MKRTIQEVEESRKASVTVKEMERYVHGQTEGQREFDSDDDDGDEVVLRSRRQQQGLGTQSTVDCSDVEALGAPGAPAKKRRRVLPWTEEGRLLWPSGVGDSDDEVVLVEDSQDDGDLDRDSGIESEVSDDCHSFVVDDGSESVVEEQNASERYLAEGALKEVRQAVMEKMEKLKKQLAAVDEQLRQLKQSERLVSPTSSTCSTFLSEEGLKGVVDSKGRLRRCSEWCATAGCRG